MPRLSPPPDVDEIEARLSREALDCYGPERLAALQGTLRQMAVWMANLATVPLALDDEFPDYSAIDGDLSR